VAITVHFEHEGLLVSLLLDIVEVARSHSGFNLAVAFADVLNDFGIADKVSSSYILYKYERLTMTAQKSNVTARRFSR